MFNRYIQRQLLNHVVRMVGNFSQPRITKEQMDELNKKLDDLLSFTESKQLKAEVLFSRIWERENITQDTIDEWMEIIRKLAKKKGLKVEEKKEGLKVEEKKEDNKKSIDLGFDWDDD